MFEIFDKWKCARCERKKETFNHVWLCCSQKKNMRNIIKISISNLYDAIMELRTTRNYYLISNPLEN